MLRFKIEASEAFFTTVVNRFELDDLLNILKKVRVMQQDNNLIIDE